MILKINLEPRLCAVVDGDTMGLDSVAKEAPPVIIPVQRDQATKFTLMSRDDSFYLLREGEEKQQGFSNLVCITSMSVLQSSAPDLNCCQPQLVLSSGVTNKL